MQFSCYPVMLNTDTCSRSASTQTKLFACFTLVESREKFKSVKCFVSGPCISVLCVLSSFQ